MEEVIKLFAKCNNGRGEGWPLCLSGVDGDKESPTAPCNLPECQPLEKCRFPRSPVSCHMHNGAPHLAKIFLPVFSVAQLCVQPYTSAPPLQGRLARQQSEGKNPLFFIIIRPLRDEENQVSPGKFPSSSPHKKGKERDRKNGEKRPALLFPLPCFFSGFFLLPGPGLQGLNGWKNTEAQINKQRLETRTLRREREREGNGGEGENRAPISFSSPCKCSDPSSTKGDGGIDVLHSNHGRWMKKSYTLQVKDWRLMRELPPFFCPPPFAILKWRQRRCRQEGLIFTIENWRMNIS